jgi:hypothetical protein
MQPHILKNYAAVDMLSVAIITSMFINGHHHRVDRCPLVDTMYFKYGIRNAAY